MRVPPWSEALARRSRELVAAIEARRGGSLLNLDRMLLWSEPLARGWNGYLRAVRTELSLSPFLRELAICAERSDISEEIARLSGHMDQFGKMLADGEFKPIGRTLDFLTHQLALWS